MHPNNKVLPRRAPAPGSDMRIPPREREARSRQRADVVQAARERAEATLRAKDAHMAMVVHDLRTPLTAILGWTRVLRRGRLDARESVRALATIERCAQSQARLIDDLLDLSHITAGKLSLNLRPVKLVPVLQAALDVVRWAFDGVRIEIRQRALVKGLAKEK